MLLIIFNTYVSNLVDAAELLFKAFILYLKNTWNWISFLIQVKYKTFQWKYHIFKIMIITFSVSS